MRNGDFVHYVREEARCCLDEVRDYMNLVEQVNDGVITTGCVGSLLHTSQQERRRRIDNDVTRDGLYLESLSASARIMAKDLPTLNEEVYFMVNTRLSPHKRLARTIAHVSPFLCCMRSVMMVDLF